MRSMLGAATSVLLALSLLGCASPTTASAPSDPAPPVETTEPSELPAGSSTAVWELAAGSTVDADSTTLDVLVMRTECNSGVTGTVEPPIIDAGGEEIVISFTVSPGKAAAATCQGNDQVEYTVTLDQPVGDRVLVDGACRGPELASTAFCESELR